MAGFQERINFPLSSHQQCREAFSFSHLDQGSGHTVQSVRMWLVISHNAPGWMGLEISDPKKSGVTPSLMSSVRECRTVSCCPLQSKMAPTCILTCPLCTDHIHGVPGFPTSTHTGGQSLHHITEKQNIYTSTFYHAYIRETYC